MFKYDHQRMIAFIISQLPDGEAKLTLASGDDGNITAEVRVWGNELEIESNCPEWVSVREIYEHLRWKMMPGWEQAAWVHANRSTELNPQYHSLSNLAERLTGLVAKIESTVVEGRSPATISEMGCEPNNPEQYLTTREVASLLACSYSEARDRMLDGRIKAIRDGRWLRTRREWIEEYVAGKLVAPPRTTSEIHVIAGRKSRQKPVIFKKGGLGYQFLKERQENQKK